VIQRNGTLASVFVADKNVVSVRNVTGRSTDGNATTAVKGLRGGETGVLSNFDKLPEGTPVKVEQAPQRAAVNPGAKS
jgi:hypothetical protein